MSYLHYLDPLGNRLPALERNILRLRSMQVMLVLFYTEQIKAKVLGLFEATEDFRACVGNGSHQASTNAKSQKNRLKRCFDILVADGALTIDQRDEIRRLTDFRNLIGHDIHELVGDLTTSRHLRIWQGNGAENTSLYDYQATDRLRYYHDLIEGLPVTHHYTGTIGLARMKFDTAERTLLADITRLMKKIQRQYDARNLRIRELNDQIETDALEYSRHPLNQFSNNRLTKRGEEVCYRLFDQGKSPMVVAHLMGVSLASSMKRQRMWKKAGGRHRQRVDLDGLTA